MERPGIRNHAFRLWIDARRLVDSVGGFEAADDCKDVYMAAAVFVCVVGNFKKAHLEEVKLRVDLRDFSSLDSGLKMKTR